MSEAKDWLRGEDSYTLFKQSRKNFKSDRIFIPAPNVQFSADLIDLPSLAVENDGYRYILTFIDNFSRFTHAGPLKDKTPATVAAAMSKLFDKTKGFTYLCTDKGSEFLGKPFKELVRRARVTRFYALNSTKDGMVERFNRTLKTRMFKLLHARGEGRYVDVLQDLLDSYNNRKHRSIGMAPARVSTLNQGDVWERLYGSLASLSYAARRRPVFKVGDLVRLSKAKAVFAKGYSRGWTDETFTVHSIVQSRTGAHRYKVRDVSEEHIECSFLREELQIAKPAAKQIRKTLRRRAGRKQVEFRGYPSTLRTWVDASA